MSNAALGNPLEVFFSSHMSGARAEVPRDVFITWPLIEYIEFSHRGRENCGPTSTPKTYCIEQYHLLKFGTIVQSYTISRF